jgi:outer membrane protein assembly factor BamB
MNGVGEGKDPAQAESTAQGKQKQSNKPVRGMMRAIRRVIGWTIIIGCVGGIIALRLLAGVMDFGQANIFTYLLVIVLGITLLVRWFVRRDLNWIQRWVPIGVVLLALVVTARLVRVDGVSGRLVPKLAWSWTLKPDQRLDAPSIVGASHPVDLKTTASYDFPQFLGPQRNLILAGPALERDWSAHPPRLMWRQAIGAGWSGFSAVNGFAVTMEQRGGQELVSCYEVEGGQMRWSHGVAARHETLAGGTGPRCTPTIDGGRVYALGATGILRCLGGATGKLLWQDAILERYGVTPESDLSAVAWGRAASPLVLGDLLIVPWGGPKGGPYVSLVAYDKVTGEIRWKGGTEQVSYASPSYVTLCGVPQILIVNASSVSGHRPEDGVVLWSYDWPGNSSANASASQAVVVADNRVLLSKAYGTGAALIELHVKEKDTWEPTLVWKRSGSLKTKFTNVVVHDGLVYGLSDGIMECVQLSDGKPRWKDRRRGDFGHGQLLLVGDSLLVQAESGEVVMLEPSGESLKELGRFPALSDQTWNNLCLYGRFLLVRNSVEAACYELPTRMSSP